MAQLSIFDNTTAELALIMLGSLVLGVFYASPSYFAQLKAVAGLSQTEINSIGAAAYIGACSLLPLLGWVIDRYVDYAEFIVAVLLLFEGGA